MFKIRQYINLNKTADKFDYSWALSLNSTLIKIKRWWKITNIDWFKFENKDLDFPIYKKNPHVSKSAWVILFIVSFLGLMLSISSNLLISILSCAIILIPLLYFLKWDYKAIFQKPKLKDVVLAVALFGGYMIYALLVGSVLEFFGIMGGELVSDFSLSGIPPLLFSLMTEELIKFIPFIFILRALYKYTNKRKQSVILSVALVMIFFASLHAYSFNMFLFALAIQGFGSIFEFIGYIKTKNILISYITHLCTDIFIYIIAIIGL